MGIDGGNPNQLGTQVYGSEEMVKHLAVKLQPLHRPEREPTPCQSKSHWLSSHTAV
jgi:hypothetical protein